MSRMCRRCGLPADATIHQPQPIEKAGGVRVYVKDAHAPVLSATATKSGSLMTIVTFVAVVVAAIVTMIVFVR